MACRSPAKVIYTKVVEAGSIFGIKCVYQGKNHWMDEQGNRMLFAKIIEELEDEKLTQGQIATLVKSKQQSIGMIKKRGSVPNWFLGQELISLHKERCPDSKLPIPV